MRWERQINLDVESDWLAELRSKCEARGSECPISHGTDQCGARKEAQMWLVLWALEVFWLQPAQKTKVRYFWRPAASMNSESAWSRAGRWTSRGTIALCILRRDCPVYRSNGCGFDSIYGRLAESTARCNLWQMLMDDSGYSIEVCTAPIVRQRGRFHSLILWLDPSTPSTHPGLDDHSGKLGGRSYVILVSFRSRRPAYGERITRTLLNPVLCFGIVSTPLAYPRAVLVPATLSRLGNFV
jgi:hypothetical protein